MKAFETLVGFLVLVFAVYAVTMFYNKGDRAYTTDDYLLYVNFGTINGLKNGSEVKLNGIKIGHVISRNLAADYKISVGMAIDKKVLLPVDSAAELSTDGLMGDRYIKIIPGSAEEKFAPDGVIEYSQSYDLNIESIINKFISNYGYSNKDT